MLTKNCKSLKINNKIHNSFRNGKDYDLKDYDLMNDFYMLAHDLKSPVNHISGLLHIAKQTNDMSKIQEIIDMAIGASNNMKLKVNQILSNVNTDTCKNAQIDFEDMIGNIKSVLVQVNGYDKTKIVVNIQNETSYFGNYAKIHSIIQNLIENAVKYRRDNVANNIVILSIADNQNKLMIKVTDNGKGIKLEDQSKIFDKCYQADNYNIGHGLGLYLVKRNVLDIGGSIDVESSEGVGSTFTITLPHVHQMELLA